jgi:hypothetical protein
MHVLSHSSLLKLKIIIEIYQNIGSRTQYLLHIVNFEEMKIPSEMFPGGVEATTRRRQVARRSKLSDLNIFFSSINFCIKSSFTLKLFSNGFSAKRPS